ncbi:putative membrane protein [Treponema primitia ZAS-2]|uniref:Putative membrane protein n=1 Tax=Treponema primitia (strain ATCC BAA-887 / DSM 12427 / ZAS-2) TaxID=545694 RepID=F5YMC0_TREPZ|nr:O-unit flippase-like protein [Treponema primitia]AEF86392.1 putative membrane protein [Treponema primitia ZAS-2]
MQIDRKDVLWNYAATFLQIAAQLILFPFILRILPQETIAIWTIFSTIIILINLLDFGFNPSFTRNVAYVFSGVKALKTNGFSVVDTGQTTDVDYKLLKDLITVMRLFYSCVSVILFFILTTIGTYYIYTVLKTYIGNQTEVYIAWFILCCINAYSFFTLYYDSLLQGRGLIKRSKQIGIIGQSSYLIVAIILILSGFGLIAIVSAQAVSIIIRRVLSYNSFYTADIRLNLHNIVNQTQRGILKAIYPNAIKIGINSIGGFLINRSPVVIGSLYLSLDFIASYGITTQIIGVISSLASVYFSTYLVQIMHYRVQNNMDEIKHIYFKSCLLFLIMYIFGGLVLIFLGNFMLDIIIKSKTPLLSQRFIIILLISGLLEANTSIAGNILLTKNEVPFFKAGLISGICILILLLALFKYTNLGVWSIIFAPCVVQCCYSYWKWPLKAYRELNVSQVRH